MLTFDVVQSLQASLHLYGRYKTLGDKYGKQRKMVDVAKQEKAQADKAVEELTRKNLALEKELSEMKVDRDRHSLESTEARAALIEEQHNVAALKAQLTSIASAALIKAKAELYKEYMSGQHANWSREEMEEMVEAYEEMCRLEADDNALPEGDDVVGLPPVDDQSTVNQSPADPVDAASTLDPPAI